VLGDAQMLQALSQYRLDLRQRWFDKARREGSTASLTILGYQNERSFVNTGLSLRQRANLRCALGRVEMTRLMAFFSRGSRH
jgi:hypothetical protein